MFKRTCRNKIICYEYFNTSSFILIKTKKIIDANQKLIQKDHHLFVFVDVKLEISRSNLYGFYGIMSIKSCDIQIVMQLFFYKYNPIMTEKKIEKTIFILSKLLFD